MSGKVMGTAHEQYTLKFTAKGDDRWVVGTDIIENVPRLVDIVSYGAAGMAVLADKDWRDYQLSFLATGTTSTPQFGFGDGIGTTWIKNITLHAGSCDRWSRRFEHGVVYLNLSKTPWTITLAEDYWNLRGSLSKNPANNGAKHPQASQLIVPAEDAVFLLNYSPPPP
jgi:hypothetical protein